jgi:hypothetical protein
MGKSPAKWLKSVLFGKKSSRSASTKAKDLSVCECHPSCVDTEILFLWSPIMMQLQLENRDLLVEC